MLRLRAIDHFAGFYYEGYCKRCGDLFVYKSHNGILKQLFDKYVFDVDFYSHQNLCISKQMKESLEKTYKNI